MNATTSDDTNPEPSPGDVQVGEAPRAPLWRRVVPILLAVGLVVLVLARIDLERFRRALLAVNYVAFFGFVFAFMLTLLSADVLATTYVYRRVVGPVSFRELWVLRAASYLPSILNHHIGQAWLTYYMARVHGAALWRVAGATLVVYATTFGGVYLLGVVAVLLGGHALPGLVPTLGLIGVAAIGYAVVLLIRPRFLRERQLLAPLFELGLGGQIVALLWRLPHVVVLFIGTWVTFFFFGVDVPLGGALARVPILMLVAAVPLAPQGIGTRDFLAQQLLAQYAQGSVEQRNAAVAAATLAFVTALTLVQLVISPLFLRRAQAMLGTASKTATDEGAQPPG